MFLMPQVVPHAVSELASRCLGQRKMSSNAHRGPTCGSRKENRMEDIHVTMHARLEPLFNRPGPRRWSARPITVEAIWNFCEAVEDANPVYWDEEVAISSRFGRLIAPPQSLMALNMHAWWLPASLRSRAAKEEAELANSPQTLARAILREYGFETLTVVTREEEYFEPFGPGDGRMGQQDRLISVSPVKQTKVGPGVFYVYETDYYAEKTDHHIARARMVMLIYDGRGGTK
jgi:uncharacterized protein